MNSSNAKSVALPYNRGRQAREAETMLDRIVDDFDDNPATTDQGARTVLLSLEGKW